MSEVEACVIRVMKQSKILDLDELMGDVLDILSNRFVPEKRMLREAIERLIEKEYLRKREGKENVFEYV